MLRPRPTALGTQSRAPRFTETPSTSTCASTTLSPTKSPRGTVVNYVGMTPDGSKVYFTSEEQLTSEDNSDASTDLYMWAEKGEENGHPLTLISKGDNPGNPGGAGNTDACDPA